MSPREQTTGEIVDKVLAIVAERLPEDGRAQIEEFVRQYYAGTAAADLAESDPLDLYGACLAHWNFARLRRPGTPKIHVYNPNHEQHGWQSTHTIVEISNDDMPFLVDSVRMSLNRRGLTMHLIIHPVMRLRRDDQSRIVEVIPRGEGSGEGATEAVIHCEVDRQTEPDVLEAIEADLGQTLEDVRRAVEDWVEMRERLRAVRSEAEETGAPPDREERDEALEFLRWLEEDHFTFLGYRAYVLSEEGGEQVLRSEGGSGLGILRDEGDSKVSKRLSALPEKARELVLRPELLIVTKSNSKSRIHRPGYMDYIGVKRFDESGNVVGEHRFMGLYTSAAYHRVPRDIPLLRRKHEKILERAGYPSNSHAAKTLENILDTFPRDELFQLPEEVLYQTAMGILHLQERQQIRLFVHEDRYQRFITCLVFVPRDRFNTQIRRRIQSILEDTLGGECSEFNVQLSESVLARLYFIVRITPGQVPEYDADAIERRLVETTRSWSDDLYAAILDQHGEERGTRLFRRYGEAFPAGYREHYTPPTAVHDVERMADLGSGRGLAMSLYRPLEAAPEVLNFKLFHAGDPISLSHALPMLENMGLRVQEELPNEIRTSGGENVWIHDFGMTHEEGEEFDLDAIRGIFQETFERIWFGDVENDGFNRLVLRAHLGWREIVVLRAYCKYLRQTGVTFSQDYMENTLAGNPHIARLLANLFRVRFDPESREGADEEESATVSSIHEALEAVASLDEDRIIRSFLSVTLATLRTNFYQKDAEDDPKPYLSFKFNPAEIPFLPEPRPMFEIFVYSPRVEGVHLRGGKVARGGLRWSDRREDFRTEVLGLVKAQIVKNAVIVPVGSKGGFVAKQLSAGGDREAIQAEGIACYKTFISGLLDLTDNLVTGEVVPPEGVVRHDEDDPYLVVAADKGTATFSDIANGVAKDYGFWLGDAFASGGSMGYDHKKMGITARGAWESVKRHFRELGLDTQTTDFTVMGIGDMAGDVFGNGMLLSKHIRLVGAFNHMHIFLDPDPDAAATWKERKRLFELPRSSWEDYDTSLISKGGGVYRRAAKSIPLSPEVRELLGVKASEMPPNDLIRAMLRAPVDLLWNGGIGTYVKSTGETDADVGDRANDSLRVDATELRCRVIGEGGNLGLTQRGRIEFALGGGRVYTDAIDNAGGVDCSDHEVNIKILLHGVVEAGDMTEKQRNELLVDMTEEVAQLVLRNNYLQTQALSLAGAQSSSMVDVHSRLMRWLEREAGLQREIEFLPATDVVLERMKQDKGLCAPELAVIMAYCKIALFGDLLDSDLPSDEFLEQVLANYFPTPLREGYRKQMSGHRLWREIICTEVANGLVNRGGMTFAFRLGEETGADPAEIARAYLAARETFEMQSLWTEIESLDNQVPAAAQIRMLLESRKLVERASRWLLRNRPRPLEIGKTVAYFSSGVATLAGHLPDLVAKSSRKAIDEMRDKLASEGVPEELAGRVAALEDLYAALDIVDIATASDLDTEEVASVYFQLGERLELHWMRDQIVELPRDNRWQALARAALRDDLYGQQRELAADALRDGVDGVEPVARIDSWLERNRAAVSRCRDILADLKAGGTPDFPMLSVAMREIRGMRQMDAPPPRAGDARSAAAKKKRARKPAGAGA